MKPLYDTLLKKIQTKKSKIGVIGLGYVGLPLAMLFAKKGFLVTGFVRDKAKKDMLAIGKSYIKDENVLKDLQIVIENKKFTAKVTNIHDLKKQDIFIVCVQTPVFENKKPDLRDLQEVARQLSEVDLTGKLIINESTVAPYATEEILGNFRPSYFLACSPERVDPGNQKKTTEFIPKIIGGKDKESLQLASVLYKEILKNDIVQVKSMEVAEMAKILENSYRAVNIGLINEFTRLAENCGIDILDVISAAKTKWTFQPHYPSIGVGGHCIPVDPYYILELANKKHVSMRILLSGLLENEHMPEYILGKLLSVYKKGMKILIYGITYKKDVGDLRESPVILFGNLLKKKKIPFSAYDPFVSEEDVQKIGFIPGSLKRTDIFVVGSGHSMLSNDYKKAVGKNTIIIDGQNFFDKKIGKAVFGLGRNFL